MKCDFYSISAATHCRDKKYERFCSFSFRLLDHVTVTYWAVVAAGVTVGVVVVQVVVVATVGVLAVEALRTLDGLPLVAAAWRVDDCKERGTWLTTVVDNFS